MGITTRKPVYGVCGLERHSRSDLAIKLHVTSLAGMLMKVIYKGADQNVHMHRLVYAFDICIPNLRFSLDEAK